MSNSGLKSFTLAATLLAVILPYTVSAEENQAVWGPTWVPKQTNAPERLVETSGVGPAFVMHAADETMARPISDWNVAGNLPVRNGIERPLPKVRLVVLPKKEPGTKLEHFGGGVLGRSAADDAVVWGLALRVEDAWRMRIRLGDVRLPEGTLIWVYGEEEEVVGPFGTELLGADGTLWTPSIGGPEIRLEISIPDSIWIRGDTPSFKVEAVNQVFSLDYNGVPIILGHFSSKDTSCLVDAACVETGDYAPIDSVTKAVAYLEFMNGGSSYICTGALVNDKVQGTYVPYLLTANHCFSSQSSASSLEAFFDYIQSPCLGSAPSLSTLPRTNGATLLKSSTVSDFTFVRLNQFPGGSRALLGWTTSEPTDGAILHRVSHPMGLPAAYSRSSKITNPAFTCGLSTTNYHFTQSSLGGTFGGSSGGALLDANGRIVGQLRGGCGEDPSDGCNYSNYDDDGKFSVTFPNISQYINDDGGGGSACQQDLANGVVCLRDGRFELIGTWTDFSNPPVTRPIIWTSVEDFNAIGGFQNNPTGIQVVMRVTGCGQTSFWWIWLGGFTDAGWNIQARDTVTGRQTTYNRTRQNRVFPTTMRDQTTFPCD